MSEKKRDIKKVSKGSRAVVGGDKEGGRNEIAESSPKPSPNPNAPPALPKESNGVAKSQSNKGSDAQRVGRVQKGEPDDGIASEDAGKDDMFVDCSDELGSNADSKELKEAVASLEMEENSGEVKPAIDGMQPTSLQQDDSGKRDGKLISDVGLKIVAREFKGGREEFATELVSLHHQLKILTNQESLLGENGSEFVDSIHKVEVGPAGIELKELINECSEFLKSALKERLQSQATIRELQAVLLMKDQQIEVLNEQVSEFSDKMLASLVPVLNQQEFLDDSPSGKIIHVERGTSLLIENYNQMLYEIDQLRHCLSGDRLDHGLHVDFRSTFSAAREELLELKEKEVHFIERLQHLEDENRNMFEQLDYHRMTIDAQNLELGKTKIELEQERIKYSNIKEKLAMAVTRGKDLVQQRNTLKQSLADKTSELERCLLELQEKSSALEAAELGKAELVKSEHLVASLQENLLQKNVAVEKLEELLSLVGTPEELQSVDNIERLRMLVDENKKMKGVSIEYHNLEDVFSLVDLPEIVSTSNLESRVIWLRESFFLARDEVIKLQDEISRTREAGHKEIERLSTSLLMELHEKDYLQRELDDLTYKYNVIVEKEHHISLQKDQILKLLLELSGINIDEGSFDHSSDISMLVNRCFQKIKEQDNKSMDSSHVDMDSFERIQSLLYARDLDVVLCEKVLEEEFSEVNNLSNKLREMSQELMTLKKERGSLKKDIEKSEEKSAVLREKLSMAVKKGKGLVQERENTKRLLDEKNSEIEKLRLEFQNQESLVAEFRSQIDRLSADVERIPMLVSDLGAMKDQRDQLQQFLLESNSKLQRVIESIDDIILPTETVFEEPVGKMYWLAGYIKECHDAKTHAEKELEKVKEEAITLASKLADTLATVGSLEDALSATEKKNSQLAEETREIEVGKINIEQQLQKAIDEALSQSKKFEESYSIRKSLEEALSHAENKISVLINEKEEDKVGRVAMEMELERAKEEMAIQTNKLAEAQENIKSLEEALSQVERNVALLREQNDEAQADRTNLEIELNRLQEEAGLRAGKLVEESLSQAENKISVLITEKEEAKVSKVAMEMELERVKEEMAVQTNKLVEAHETIKSLEDSLFEVERNVALLREQKDEVQTAKTNLEFELKSLQEEARSQACKLTEKEEAKVSKVATEMELARVKEEMAVQTNKLVEAHETIKSLEDSLSEVERNVALLREQKDEVQTAKTNFEFDLKRLQEEARSQTGKLVEEALSQAESKISVLVTEKEEAKVSRISMEMDLQRAKEEIVVQTNKLAEAHETIKSLEDALSQAENNVSLLREQNDEAKTGRTNLQIELERLQQEIRSQASELVETHATIKSLEDALLKAESDKSVLEHKSKNAEEEILMLTSELNKCMEELSGTSGSLERTSGELAQHLKDFQELMKDDTLLCKVTGRLEKKFESLKDVNLILKNINDYLVDGNLEDLQGHYSIEDSYTTKPFSNVNFGVDVGKANSEVIADSGDNTSSSFRKTLEGFQLRNKILADKFEGFSDFMDEFIADLLTQLKATRDRIVVEFKHIESLKRNTKDLEMFKQDQENTTAMVKNEVTTLLAACTNAARELQFEAKNSLLDISSVPELEKLKKSQFLEMDKIDGDDAFKYEQFVSDSKYVKAVEELLLSTRKVKCLAKQFESTSFVAAATIRDLQKQLEKARTTSERIIEERDLNRDRVLKMETDVETLQSSGSSLRLQLEHYQAKEEKLKEREAEVSSLYHNLLMKEQEVQDYALMSASQTKTLFAKIREIEIPKQVASEEIHSATDVNKLFHIIDSFVELQHQINVLFHDNEKLQSTVASQVIEVENLRKEVKEETRNKRDLENMKNQLLEVTLSLEKVVSLFGGGLFVRDQNSDGAMGLVRVLEKQVMAVIMESENLKSKADELDVKLLGSQKFVNELSAKVRLLEESLQTRTAQPEIVQERNIFDAPSLPSGSEISEIEDGPLGKSSISSVPSAAHVRIMRKGSTDHLALNIDSESDRLIQNSKETDEDKGHVFKSLNASGLVPRQGRLIADRLDGIWVSGGRVLMSRPGARLSFIAYWLLLHIWLLGTIL